MSGETGYVPNQPKTPQRAIRVPDELWKPAQSVAKARGESLSEVVREALADYIKRHPQQ